MNTTMEEINSILAEMQTACTEFLEVLGSVEERCTKIARMAHNERISAYVTEELDRIRRMRETLVKGGPS